MSIRPSFLAACAILLVAATVRAEDLALKTIHIADRGATTQVELTFQGRDKPKGRVSVTDDKVIVELQGVKPAKTVSADIAKSALITGHILTESKQGTPTVVLTTRGPLKLAAAPSATAGDKKNAPRLTFLLERAAAIQPAPAQAQSAPAAEPTMADLEAAAKAGNVAAQMRLAALLVQQEKPDFAGALRWYRAAAEQGSGPAAFNVAQYTRLGQGTKADPAQAFKWYERAAASGFPPAQVALAIQLIKGENTPRDIARARFLLQQAAGGGDAQAQGILDSLGSQQ